MVTISSDKNLTLWAQNKNHVDYIVQNINDNSYDILIRNIDLSFFNELKTSFNNCNKYSFCVEWQKVSKGFYKNVKNQLKLYFKCSDDDADRISNKIRGNIGEIFAEKFFLKLGNKWIKAETYSPIDPTNERFVDANAQMNDGIICGIQIKNHKGEIKSDVFHKACTEDSITLRELEPSGQLKYLERKRQFLFSFTDEKFSPNMDFYKKIVQIIGPNDIDLELKDNQLRIDMINEIIEELSNGL